MTGIILVLVLLREDLNHYHHQGTQKGTKKRQEYYDYKYTSISTTRGEERLYNITSATTTTTKNNII